MGTGKQRRALLLVALAAVLANASWFSATAVVPALQQDWHLTPAGAAWLVIMVQIGFVTGSVVAALLNLPDRIEPRRLIAGRHRWPPARSWGRSPCCGCAGCRRRWVSPTAGGSGNGPGRRPKPRRPPALASAAVPGRPCVVVAIRRVMGRRAASPAQ